MTTTMAKLNLSYNMSQAHDTFENGQPTDMVEVKAAEQKHLEQEL